MKTSSVAKISVAEMSGGASKLARESHVVELRLKDLTEKVVEASGQKKGVTRSILEAGLKEIGEALVRGETVNLPGLGKLQVKRQKVAGTNDIVICKLRRKKVNEDTSPVVAAE